MAPDWVLLDRLVPLCFDEEDDGSAAAAAVKAVSSPLFEATDAALLGSMKPHTDLREPPGISTFRLLGSASHLRLWRGYCPDPIFACADKSLLVLYGGPSGCARLCYIVFDAGTSPPLLSTVPLPPRPLRLNSIGIGTVVLRREPPSSAYLLAELSATPSRRIPDAELYLWRSDDEPTLPQWATKAVRLPPEACWTPGKHFFCADTAFSVSGRGTEDTLFWVDLLHGIIACTNPTQDDPELRFVPLPDECPAIGPTDDWRYRPHMDQFRAAACVGGAIKFVAMVGVLEDWELDQFRLTTWTLSPDMGEWRLDGVFPLKDIWAADEFRALNVPQRMPICPVLTLDANEDVVVYVAVNDVDELGAKVEFRGQYIVGLDVCRNKIISTGSRHPNEVALKPHLCATNFPAYLQGEKGHRQMEVEASNVENGKRLKSLQHISVMTEALADG